MFKIITDQDSEEIIKYIIRKNIGDIIDDSFYQCLKFITKLDLDHIKKYFDNNISILSIKKEKLDMFCQEYGIGLKIIDLHSNIFYNFSSNSEYGYNYVILNLENYDPLFFPRSYEICSQLNDEKILNLNFCIENDRYYEKIISLKDYDSKKYDRKLFGKQKLLSGLLSTREIIQNMIKINSLVSDSNQVKNIDKIKNTNLNSFFNSNIDELLVKEQELYDLIMNVELEINELKYFTQ